ncbi:MAG: glycosyltransferase family 4 protein [Chloroflexota bacterium]
MRIGLVIYGSLDTLSGGYLYDRKLVEYLRAQGDTVEVISLPWRNYAAHLADNLRFRLPVSSVIASERRSSRPSVLRGRIEAKREKQSPIRQLDVLIQDELNHPSLLLANRHPHPYPVISLVHHLRCSEPRPKWQNAFYRAIEKKYLESVDGFIFNSQTTKSVVNELVDNEKPSIVAYPPTDRFGEAISEHEIIERAKSPELRILFLGNVIERKGLHTLLDALAVGQNDILSYRLDIVGSLTTDPVYAKAMQERVVVNRLEPALSEAEGSVVHFHGALDREPLIEKLQAAHVLVVPSSYEGFGIAYLEGMGFGLPAIGTTAGAAAEVIADGVDGFLVSPGDARELADRLRVLAEKREVLIRMSLAARERYLRQPKWEQTAGQIREFLQKQIAAFSV